MADEVTLLDGTKFSNCKVLSENAAEVQLDLTQGAAPGKVVRSEEVADIQYADRPLEYRQAHLFLASGNYERAEKAFRALGETAPASSWLATYAAYYRALALVRWAASEPGRTAAAVAALGEFAGRHANSRFIYEARLSLAEAHMLQDKAAEVRRLAEAVIAEKPGTRWAQTGRLLLARVKLNEGDAVEAGKDFEAVLATAGDKASPVWAQATVGKGLALVAQDKLEEAEALLSRLIETTEDGAVRARAYNALGDAYFKRGNFAEARIRYLRVVLLYFQADAAEHAKALYQAAECFRRLNDPQRAEALLRELVRRHPGTPWAAKAPVGAPETAPEQGPAE